MTTRNPGKEALIELYNGQMLNYRQIGEKYGVSVRAVQKWFKALGIPARNPGFTIAKNRKQGKRGRPPKRAAILADKPPKGFYAVEVHRGGLPLKGPALRLPEHQQRKVERLLVLFRYHEIVRERMR